MTHTFKIGDRVRVLDTQENRDYFYLKDKIGHIGTVVDIGKTIINIDMDDMLCDGEGHYAWRFEHVKDEMIFDITADISRQYTRDGRKVLAIFDSGLDVEYPIAVWIDGELSPRSVDTVGNIYKGEENSSDVITQPIILPDVVKYVGYGYNGYGNIVANCVHDSKENAISDLIKGFAVVKLTFNPNTLATSSEVVWKAND